MNGELSSTA